MYKENITWGYNNEALHPITGKETIHKGIDVAVPTGTSVFATGDGVVKKAAEEKGWGKLVVVEHEDGYATFYAHMDEIGVESGTKVHKGEVIGRVGSTGQSTGPHLHYEVRKDGNHLNPADFY
jgi:murein DD-endopeptidase MepM/ murein hydrolase activator NlpD